MVDDLLPKDSKEPVKVKTSVIKVRGKTIIVGNSVYQIHNITSLSFVDLTTEEKKTKQYFKYYFISLFIGIVLLLVPNITVRILGLLILAVDILLFVKNHRNKITERYGLVIEGNSGYKNIIVSPNKFWIQTVIVELWDVINSGPEKLKSLTFDFDNYSITSSILGSNSETSKSLTFNFNDYSIHGNNIVGNNVNSPIVSNNNVKGDVDVDNIIPGVADFRYDLYLLAITKLLNNKYLRLFGFYFHTLIQQRRIP
ncbi:MAG: DUF6232 family protein [Microcoleaceae cyanobacterium MO_207.B10]|nr:DUF6232 family protein [Microcoleaceae cyanobacterium MO_207.B10]